MNTPSHQQRLLTVAARQRRENGYIADFTRLALEDIGMTAAGIESALSKLENTNG